MLHDIELDVDFDKLHWKSRPTPIESQMREVKDAFWKDGNISGGVYFEAIYKTLRNELIRHLITHVRQSRETCFSIHQTVQVSVGVLHWFVGACKAQEISEKDLIDLYDHTTNATEFGWLMSRLIRKITKATQYSLRGPDESWHRYAQKMLGTYRRLNNHTLRAMFSRENPHMTFQVQRELVEEYFSDLHQRFFKKNGYTKQDIKDYNAFAKIYATLFKHRRELPSEFGLSELSDMKSRIDFMMDVAKKTWEKYGTLSEVVRNAKIGTQIADQVAEVIRPYGLGIESHSYGNHEFHFKLKSLNTPE